MVRNAEKLEMATQFRRRGFSYSEIAKICGVSKGTVGNWLSKKKFSKQVKKENAERAAKENKKRMMLLNKARSVERNALYREALRTAETEFKHYRTNPLFIAGLMLYKGEGDNRHRRLIRIANADPDVHRIFMKFTREFLGVERKQIKFWLLLYPDLSQSVCVREWSRRLKLADTQWYKNQVIQGRSLKRTLHFGVGNTIIGSTVLKQKLMKWVELATKQL